jgi:branched-subunit amino acid transport protein AzlD
VGFDIIFSWQALLLAVICVVVMMAVKRLLDYVWKNRKKNRFMTRIGMPLIHGVVGFLGGVLVPFRPETVIAYVVEHNTGHWVWIAYGFWGLIVGGLAGDVLYTKFKKFLTHGS